MNLIDNNPELNYAVRSFINETVSSKARFLDNDTILAKDRLSNFERVIKCQPHNVENHSIYCIVTFYNILDKKQSDFYVGVNVNISLVDDLFDDAVDGITKTKHLNIVAESLDTLEVTSALAKLCDVAIDMLGEINESN